MLQMISLFDDDIAACGETVKQLQDMVQLLKSLVNLKEDQTRSVYKWCQFETK